MPPAGQLEVTAGQSIPVEAVLHHQLHPDPQDRVGREALYDPNWPLHAAAALGVDPEFARWPVQYGWWLTRRASLLKKLGVNR